jgi:nucleoside-diphosphate-sugar epimerase
MKLIITGAGGFIAQNFLKFLVKKNKIEIKAFLRKKKKVFQHKNIKYIIKKIEHINEKDLAGYSSLFHFASTGAKNFYQNKSFFNEFCNTYNTNVIHTISLIKRCIKVGIKKFVVPGTCFEYGHEGDKKKKLSKNSTLKPKGYYSISKASLFLHLKHLAKEYSGLKILYLRYFQVYGDGEKLPRLWPQLKFNAKNNLNFIVENGNLIRDFISVERVCNLTWNKFINNKKKGISVHNIGTGKGKTIKNFAQKWWKIFQGRKKLKILNKKTEHISYLVAKI